MAVESRKFHFNPEVSLGNLVNVITIIGAAIGVTWNIQSQLGQINTKAEVNAAKIANSDSRITQEVEDRKEDRLATTTQLKSIDDKVQTLILMQTKDPP